MQYEYYLGYFIMHCKSRFLRLIFYLRNMKTSGQATSWLKHSTFFIFLTEDSVRNMKIFYSFCWPFHSHSPSRQEPLWIELYRININSKFLMFRVKLNFCITSGNTSNGLSSCSFNTCTSQHFSNLGLISFQIVI